MEDEERIDEPVVYDDLVDKHTDELTEMLSQSGFEVKAVYRDMSTDSLQADSDRAVFVARIREAINRE